METGTSWSLGETNACIHPEQDKKTHQTKARKMGTRMIPGSIRGWPQSGYILHMYVCIYVYIYICACTHKGVYVCTCIPIYIQIYTYEYIYDVSICIT